MSIELLACSKNVEYDVKTSEMSSKMSRHRDNTNKQVTTLMIKAESKKHKLFVNLVWCNVTYVWGLLSQEGNSL